MRIKSFLDALGAGDEAAATAVALARVDAGADPVDVMFDLVVPAQREVGRQYFQRDIAPEPAVVRAVDLAHSAGA